MNSRDAVTVVVAIEPPLYREAIVRAVRRLRPGTVVLDLEPDLLHAAVSNLVIDVVVADRLPTPALCGVVPWVALFPEGQPRVVVRTESGVSIRPDLDFGELLSLSSIGRSAIDPTAMPAKVRRFWAARPAETPRRSRATNMPDNLRPLRANASSCATLGTVAG